jgi:MYXO-CTERM domain-containing protein
MERQSTMNNTSPRRHHRPADPRETRTPILGRLLGGALWLVLAASAGAQSLLSEVSVVGGDVPPVTVDLAFENGGGPFTLSLVDENFPVVDGFTALEALLVDDADTVVGRASLDAALDFEADPARTYRVIVVGELRGGGAALFTVRVRDGDGQPVFTAFDRLLAPVPPLDSSTLIEEIDVVDGGDYTLRIQDFAFPVPLDTLQVLLLRQSDGLPVAGYDLARDGDEVVLPLPGLVPGVYELAVFVEPGNARDVGVFGIEIRGGPFDDGLFARSVPVAAPDGTALGATPFEIGAGGTYTLTLTDFAFPAALDGLGGLVLRAGQRVAQLKVPPSSVQFQAFEDTAYQLIVDAVPDALAGVGTFGANIAGGPFGDTVVDAVGTVENADAGDGFDVSFGVPGAGDYRLEVVDFGFPSPLTDLTVLLLRGPQLVLSLSGSGAAEFSAAGPEVFSVVLSGTADTDGGIVGLSVRPAAGGDAVLERNVALGSDFVSRSFTVTQTERHRASAEDLAFPASFADLRTVVTRGSQVVGSILTAGSFTFDATPGDYNVSVLAVPGASDFGTFSLQVAVDPPMPPEPPEPPVEPPQTGGGGGGSSLTLPLLALFGLIAGRRRRHARGAAGR